MESACLSGLRIIPSCPNRAPNSAIMPLAAFEPRDPALMATQPSSQFALADLARLAFMDELDEAMMSLCCCG
jgi:hypothetical protein